MYEFKSKVELEIIGSKDIQAAGGECKVCWQFDVLKDESSIINFDITVPEQTIQTKVIYYDEDLDEEIERNFTIDLKNVYVVADVDDINYGIRPTKLQVHLGKATLFMGV